LIFLDTSVLIDCLCGAKCSAPAIRQAIERGERILIPSLVLYEWLRGPRLPAELQAQEDLFPARKAIQFGPEEAAEAARLYTTVSRARGREVDLAIAACAMTWEADLWTLNAEDFEDIPGLRVSHPR